MLGYEFNSHPESAPEFAPPPMRPASRSWLVPQDPCDDGTVSAPGTWCEGHCSSPVRNVVEFRFNV